MKRINPFTVSVVLWAIVLTLIVTVKAFEDASHIQTKPDVPEASQELTEDDGRLPGDDVPATEYAVLTNWEESENELIEAALLERANKIDDCVVTHYDVCVKCCGKEDGITDSGRKGTPYVSVAVDTSVIPLGSDVLVDYGDGELHYYRADDTGSGVKGSHIDLMVNDHEEALELGKVQATVYWVEDGNE